ncbi:hypothetical protein CCMA1212_009652 [Trichoderma ghanense]|uniref:Uncharacterized protein n=1 Tax=Trichoderma ghanense TaxID=65468 RepID=A0ABY2GS70_9HYPO
MISAKHHALNTLICLPTLLATPIRALLQDHLSIYHDINTILEYSIAFYALCFCLYLVEARTTMSPAAPSASARIQRVRARGFWERWLGLAVWAAVEGREVWFWVGTGLMGWVVGDCALWVVGGEESGREVVVRGLGTVVFGGVLMPFWFGRSDVEAHEMIVSSMSRGGETWTVLYVIDIAALVLCLISITGYMSVFTPWRMGKWVKDAVEWWFPVGMMPHQAFLMLWLLSPFTDMLDTILYAVYKK